jgi:hypothetical protein
MFQTPFRRLLQLSDAGPTFEVEIPMPTLPARAAAYTRTGVLRKFVDLLSQADPGRVDAAYAEQRLGLKGGDVRAFLQSLRVLGLIDPYGETTDRARRMRAVSQRAAAMREALTAAYPELVEEWDSRGGMARQALEDFFKVQYGLSNSSAGPAAKLFEDLMREYGQKGSGGASEVRGAVSRAPERASFSGRARESEYTPDQEALPGYEARGAGSPLRAEPPVETSPRSGTAREGSFPGRSAAMSYYEDEEAAPSPRSRRSPPETVSPTAAMPLSGDVRLAALEAVRSALRIDINAEWDERRINLVFDRMERLVARILEG